MLERYSKIYNDYFNRVIFVAVSAGMLFVPCISDAQNQTRYVCSGEDISLGRHGCLRRAPQPQGTEIGHGGNDGATVQQLGLESISSPTAWCTDLGGHLQFILGFTTNLETFEIRRANLACALRQLAEAYQSDQSVLPMTYSLVTALIAFNESIPAPGNAPNITRNQLEEVAYLVMHNLSEAIVRINQTYEVSHFIPCLRNQNCLSTMNRISGSTYQFQTDFYNNYAGSVLAVLNTLLSQAPGRQGSLLENMGTDETELRSDHIWLSWMIDQFENDPFARRYSRVRARLMGAKATLEGYLSGRSNVGPQTQQIILSTMRSTFTSVQSDLNCSINNQGCPPSQVNRP